ncbi:tyrosine-type recombinase/integrase [Hungatella hathewayi]
MAKAKKLPSGSWRCQVYSHSIPMTDKDGNPVFDSNGKRKEKRIYESFTSDDPTPAGKREAELAAAQFAVKKERLKHTYNYTVTEAIDKYIKSSDAVLSPTTIQGYRSIQKNSFQDIMNMPLKKLTTELLKEAVNREARRPSNKRKKNSQPISPKTVSNSYGLLTAVINQYYPSLDCTVRLPEKEIAIKDLIPPEVIMDVVKGTPIELPVLLAMWLSFSMSEVRGLTKSKSIHDGYITIEEVIVDIGGKPIRKKQAKTKTRIRKHRIPPYILDLINQLPEDTDELVTMSSQAIYSRFRRLLKKNGLPHMTFHDLRHVNASVMALLRIPDKYAMERGGWKTDVVMKKVYMHTFSPEREDVDNMIDAYFEKKMQHEMQHKNKKA